MGDDSDADFDLRTDSMVLAIIEAKLDKRLHVPVEGTVRPYFHPF